jgi:hypothetical protein
MRRAFRGSYYLLFPRQRGLLFGVYRRHCNALNAERFQLLKATRAEGQPPQLEKVIEAFVLPALSIAQTPAGGVSCSRLRAVLAAEDSKLLDQLVTENFDLLERRVYRRALRMPARALARRSALAISFHARHDLLHCLWPAPDQGLL